MYEVDPIPPNNRRQRRHLPDQQGEEAEAERALLARQKGASATDYLGLTLPRKSGVVASILVVVIFILVGNGITWLLGRNIVTDLQLNIYRTASAAGYPPWLWLAVVVGPPTGEETLFRGFLFRGWHRTSPDAWLAIFVTALLWGIIHPQYDLYFIAQVFAYGLVLGWFRWVTGSPDHADARPGQF
jgi:CAAX protease family protein